ncbi:MAG: hypothetical protein ACTS27_04595 [Phycisphaerales bacterium]
MLRTPMHALALGLTAAVATGGIDPIPLCSFPPNGNFGQGFAFWSPDVELGEFGITSTNALVSADPLAFLPNNGNIATFFTEASADWDCRTPNGSAASSTVVLSRTVLSATAPTLRFQYGAMYSYLVTRGGVVEYTISAILTNRSTGREFKCTLSRGSRTSVAGEEGIIQVPFTTFTSCVCTGNNAFSAGDEVEIEVIFSVRADGDPMNSIAFIGGPGYADNFQFCNLLCFEPADKQSVEPLVSSRRFSEIALPDNPTPDELRRVLFDVDGDGEVTFTDLTRRAEAHGVIDMTTDADAPIDLDGDGMIGPNDLREMLILLNEPNPTRGDINRDGVVDTLDLDALANVLR